MSANIHRLTHAAVLAAMDEFVALGRTAFLARYGFGPARGYFVRHPHQSAHCDSKAIVGAAYGIQYPAEGPLGPGEFSGGEATVAKLLETLGFEVIRPGDAGVQGDDDNVGRRDWSRYEVELLVADYLQMLTLELTGQAYNKAARRRALMPLLNGRTEAAIEFKRRNVSAVMGDLGYPCIRGYLPAENTQTEVLTDMVAAQTRQLPMLDKAAESYVELPAVEIEATNFRSIRSVPPVRKLRTGEPIAPYKPRTPARRDYLEREARNRTLGAAGEKLILQYEQWRLADLGLGQLADKVRHVSVIEGDGLGYDILSFEPDGQERFVEVKTTSFGESTPFFVSANEVKFARSEPERFKLCRVFDFRKEPRFFELSGPVERHCHLDPSTYRASL